MPDPRARFSQRTSDLNGVGPYKFVMGVDFGSGDLLTGESVTLDLRAAEFNGTSGYYVVLSESGYNEIQVTNRDTGNPITIEVNDSWEMPVEPSAIQSDSQEGMYRFTITNDGAGTIASGDVILTLEHSPYGADASARETKRAPAVRRVIKKFTGL